MPVHRLVVRPGCLCRHSTGKAAQVRAVDSLEVVQLFSCLDRVKRLEWCPRSEYLLCQLKTPVVQARKCPHTATRGVAACPP